MNRVTDVLKELVETVRLIQKILKDLNTQGKDHEDRLNELEWRLNQIQDPPDY